MKTYVLFALINLSFLFPLFGKIINGYQKQINSARLSLMHLRTMPPHKKVRKQIRVVTNYILCYETTERLLRQFKDVAPRLYAEIDTIQDHNGRPVDVYVKFVVRNRASTANPGHTSIRQLASDKHAYYSNYGPHTVSITAAIASNSLAILAHEFGHVSYQVPNLANYMNFISENYRKHEIDASSLGHKAHDPSGQRALAFEREFRNFYRSYGRRCKCAIADPIQILTLLTKDIHAPSASQKISKSAATTRREIVSRKKKIPG